MKDAIEPFNRAELTGAPLHEPAIVAQSINEIQREKPGASFDALILDAKLRQSLVTMRSLGRRRMRVAALEIASIAKSETSQRVAAFSSRWCQRAFIAPGYEQDSESFLSYLKQVLDAIGASVLITSSDGTLAVIRRYRVELERLVHIPLAKESALAIAVDKDQTLEIAKRSGIYVPGGVHINVVDEVTAAIREVGLPAVVKPVESWLWGEDQGVRLSCIVVTTLDEARLAVEELTRLGGTILLQQLLSDRRESVHLMYANGVVYARFAQWARRTQPQLGGTSVYRQSIAVPQDIGEQSERLVREIDLEGYSEIEFRRDSTGKPHLMEINPRLSASIEVAIRAGVDFPYLLYQWAMGNKPDHVEGYRAGCWMRHLGGDIVTTLQTFKQPGRPDVTPSAKALWEFFASFLVPAHYDYLDWSDPLPAWVASTDFTSFLMKRLSSHLLERTHLK